MDSTNDSITVGVRCLDGRDLPQYQTPGAAAFDLAAAADLVVAPGQLALVPTGLIFAIPEHHFLAIVARSSLPKRGLIVANGLGVLDSDYRGPLGVALVNLGLEPYTIRHGDRVAQAVIAPVVQAGFVVVQALDETGRGEGGFGSTGFSTGGT